MLTSYDKIWDYLYEISEGPLIDVYVTLGVQAVVGKLLSVVVLVNDLHAQVLLFSGALFLDAVYHNSL